MRLINKNVILLFIYRFGFSYPAPFNLSYFWNFGSLALLCLVFQLLTGIFLAMHYTPHVDLAFSSVEHIMRDVNYGWFLRYLHANGASMFFIVVYIHVFRGLYYNSFTYPRQWLWFTGVVILLLMILTAFLGYVLPWGQMSFWAATVITNLLSVVPFVGTDLVYWLWGGFAVDNATLNRFFSLHYLLPFIILALSFIHLIFLHEFGSNNPLGVALKADFIPFTPYYTVKDLFGVVLFFIFAGFFIYFAPNYLGHPDNYILANPLVTPTHIVPEWYFLPFYAILRSIPDKLLGVLALLASIVVLLLLPLYLKVSIRSLLFRTFSKILFWIFVVDCLVLGWIGGKPIESPYYEIGQFATVFYFSYFLLILPALNSFERFLMQYWYSYYYTK